jgi:hypothetical protein
MAELDLVWACFHLAAARVIIKAESAGKEQAREAAP